MHKQLVRGSPWISEMIDFTMDLKINHLLSSFLKSKNHSLFVNRAIYMGASEEVSHTVYGKVKSIKLFYGKILSSRDCRFHISTFSVVI